MGRIILARHGETYDNRDCLLGGARDTMITPKGLEQAFDLVRRLEREQVRICHVFHSPLIRSEMTAIIPARIFGVGRSVIESLRERHHGILEGRPYSDIPTIAKIFIEKWGKTFVVEVEGGEGYPELCERAKLTLFEIKSKIEELNLFDDVLVIGHGAINRAMNVVNLGLTWEQIHDFNAFDNCEFRILELG